MPKEIERKFLVSGTGWRKRARRGQTIRQAYLALTGKIALRVRVVGGRKAFLTIKSEQSATTRAEFEYAIPLKDARALLKLRTGRLIEKRRHRIKAGKSRFELDVFEGALRGLVIAEIELPRRRAKFERPDWLGREVTGHKRYYNAVLARA
jgi:adenylate cyclase